MQFKFTVIMRETRSSFIFAFFFRLQFTLVYLLLNCSAEIMYVFHCIVISA